MVLPELENTFHVPLGPTQQVDEHTLIYPYPRKCNYNKSKTFSWRQATMDLFQIIYNKCHN